MREGKISYNILQRSILKNITPRDTKVLLGADNGNDMSVYHCDADISEGNDGYFLLSASHIGTVPSLDGELFTDIVRNGILRTANDLYTAQVYGDVRPAGFSVDWMLPDNFEERDLKKLMWTADAAAQELGCTILGGHTTVAACEEHLYSAVFCVNMMGYFSPGSARIPDAGGRKHPAVPGQDIFIAGTVGMEGTSLLCSAGREKLKKRYREEFLEGADAFRSRMLIREITEAVCRRTADEEVSVMHNLSEGGVFGGLWEFAERSGIGFEVDLKKIPIAQETVEISEFFEINPYQLLSGGAVLGACNNFDEVKRRLAELGIPAEKIGRVTEGKQRLIHNGEEIRYLELPQEDSVYLGIRRMKE